jgi:hypothetical protein
MGQRYEGKSTTIKGMGGVYYLELVRAVFRQVVERGIKLVYRSTIWTTDG